MRWLQSTVKPMIEYEIQERKHCFALILRYKSQKVRL